MSDLPATMSGLSVDIPEVTVRRVLAILISRALTQFPYDQPGMAGRLDADCDLVGGTTAG